MKTFLLNDDGAQLTGFEIANSFLSSGGIAKCIGRVEGCEVLRTRRLFSADEVHLHFSFSGKRFMVWEPFGDNSRLWVGPDEGEEVPEEMIQALRERFQGANRVGLGS